MIIADDKALYCAGCKRLMIYKESGLVVTCSPATPYDVATVHDDFDCLEAFRTLNPGWYSRREVLETVRWWRAGGVIIKPFAPGGWEDLGHAKLVVVESAA